MISLRPFKYILSLGVSLFVAFACQQDEPQRAEPNYTLSPLRPAPQHLQARGLNLNNPEGILILSEGSLSSEAGHLSFVSPEEGLIANGIIKALHRQSLGSITQDLALYKERLYILSQNGKDKQHGGMAHISVFDRVFRHIEDYSPDVVVDANILQRPKHIALAHDNIYFYAGGSIYECELNSEPRGISHELFEINEAIDERLWVAQRSGEEYLYVAGKRHIYELGAGLELKSYTLPKGQQSLAMALAPALVAPSLGAIQAPKEDVYIWVLTYEAQTGKYYLIKLRNLQEEVVHPLPLQLQERSASDISLRVVNAKEGALLLFKNKGKLYRFDWRDKALRTLYTSGNEGRNILYGYLGVSLSRGEIYLSEFEDYSKYQKAWISTLSLSGQVLKRYGVAPPGDTSLSGQSLYTPFCAGIYPIRNFYAY